MAGKISELNSLTGATAATTDLVEVVDVSDTSLAASGTNKKMTLIQLGSCFGSSGRIPLGGYSLPVGIDGGTAGNQAVANLLFFWHYFTVKSVTMTNIGALVSTIEAGSLLRFGVYACDQDTGKPGARIADCGTVTGASSGGRELTGLSVSIPAGWFCVAGATSNHSTVRWQKPTISAATVATTFANVFWQQYNWTIGYALRGTDYSAALPDPAPASVTGIWSADIGASGNANAPQIGALFT